MPSRTNGAPCTIRLTRLPAERKSEFRVWKKITIAIRPTMIGSAPLSPLLTRFTQIRAYSPIESATSSGAPAIPASSLNASPLAGPSATITSPFACAGSGPRPCSVGDMVQPSPPPRPRDGAGRSRVTYKGALQGEQAHAVWIGDVLIRPEATGTD